MAIKEGVCIRPQIIELIQDKKFVNQLGEVEKAAWISLKSIKTNFGGRGCGKS
jgi:hypothetical protein